MNMKTIVRQVKGEGQITKVKKVFRLNNAAKACFCIHNVNLLYPKYTNKTYRFVMILLCVMLCLNEEFIC